MNKEGWAMQNHDHTGSCVQCCRRMFCRRMNRLLAAIAAKEQTYEDLEFKIRFRSLMQALIRLDYNFPDGMGACELARLDSREARDLLREAQELLIEINESCLASRQEAKSV